MSKANNIIEFSNVLFDKAPFRECDAVVGGGLDEVNFVVGRLESEDQRHVVELRAGVRAGDEVAHLLTAEEEDVAGVRD